MVSYKASSWLPLQRPLAKGLVQLFWGVLLVSLQKRRAKGGGRGSKRQTAPHVLVALEPNMGCGRSRNRGDAELGRLGALSFNEQFDALSALQAECVPREKRRRATSRGGRGSRWSLVAGRWSVLFFASLARARSLLVGSWEGDKAGREPAGIGGVPSWSSLHSSFEGNWDVSSLHVQVSRLHGFWGHFLCRGNPLKLDKVVLRVNRSLSESPGSRASRETKGAKDLSTSGSARHVGGKQLVSSPVPRTRNPESGFSCLVVWVGGLGFEPLGSCRA